MNRNRWTGKVIPEFNHSFVLPPFVGEQFSHARGSPYVVTALELVQRFATSPERSVILRGLIEYRSALRGLGFVQGFQWLDGSFVENIEAHQNRAPQDVDLVTFAYLPPNMNHGEINQMLGDHTDLFVRERCIERFKCDTFLVRLTKQPEKLAQDVRYWYGLFSHRRGDQIWKGMLQLELQSNDELTRPLLDNMKAGGDNVATA